MEEQLRGGGSFLVSFPQRNLHLEECECGCKPSSHHPVKKGWLLSQTSAADHTGGGIRKMHAARLPFLGSGVGVVVSVTAFLKRTAAGGGQACCLLPHSPFNFLGSVQEGEGGNLA